MSEIGGRLAFGPFLLDERRGALLRAGEPVALTPKAYATLLHFLRHPGRLISKQELLDTVWPGQHVEPNNLDQQISQLRKLLGDGYLETVPRRGYRFTADVHSRSSVDGAPAADRLAAATTPVAVASTLAGTSMRRLGALGVLLAVVALVGFGLRLRGPSVQLAEIHSVAVLPFVGLTPLDALGEGIGVGLADGVITRLGSQPNLQVRPATAVLRYEHGADLAAAGTALRVDGVLQTTVHREGERLHAEAKLVATRTSAVVWHTRLDLPAGQLAQLEDTLAERLGASLLGDRGASAAVSEQAERVDPVAHVAYLLGRWHWSRRTGADFIAAERAFERALAREPGYARAEAGLADALLAQGTRDGAAEAAARRALRLDDTLAGPHATLGFLAWFRDRQAAAAQAHLQRAIELDASYATAYQWLAFVHVAHGRCNAATTEIEHARAIDPLSATLNTDVAHVRYYCGDLAAAEREARAALELELDSSFAQAHNVLGHVLLEQGRVDEASHELAPLVGIAMSPHLLRAELAARNGRSGEANAEVHAALAEPRVDHYAVACVLARNGAHDDAVVSLERAFAERESTAMLVGVDPAAAPLRRDARVLALLARLGLPAAPAS